MSKSKLEDCKKLLAKADKLAKGGFFTKKKPNEAEKVYGEAKKIVRFLKPETKEIIQLYLRALKGLETTQDEQSYYNSAGKTCEEAARACSNSKFAEIKAQTYKYYDKAGYYFRCNKQYDYASQQIKKAAQLLGETDIDGAIELFKKCISINEDEMRHRQTEDFFDAAIRFAVLKKKYKIAIEFLERQLVQQEFNKYDLRKRIHRNTASIVIIYCFLKNVKGAQKTFYDHMQKYHELGETDELQLASDVLDIFENKDEEKLIKLKKSQDIGMYLLNCIGRLVKRQLNLDGITKIEKPKIDFNKKKGNNNKVPTIVDEFKKDIDPDMLKSDIHHESKIREDGKPELLEDNPPDLLIDGESDGDDDNNNNNNNNNKNNNDDKNKEEKEKDKKDSNDNNDKKDEPKKDDKPEDDGAELPDLDGDE